MKRSYVVVGLILLFIGASFGQAVAESKETHTASPSLKNNTAAMTLPDRGLGLSSIVSLSWDVNGTQEPLQPGGAPRTITIVVSYRTVSSMLIGRLTLLFCRLTHQSVTVQLGIGEIPSWCTASLSNHELTYLITGNESFQQVSLTVAVDENAPANRLCEVPLQASVETLHGPLGLLPLVGSDNLTSIIHFLTAYRPNISVIPENDTMAVIPNESSYLRIFITNTGNERTMVHGSIVHTPSNYWIAMMTDQIILEVNDTGVMYLFVVPPVNFSGTDTIILSFTPYKYDDQSQHGEPVYLLITVTYEPP